MVRIFFSGPGSFSVNRYDSIGSQLYVMVHQLITLPLANILRACELVKVLFLLNLHYWRKPSPVIICQCVDEKEAVDRKLDFVIAVDPQGNITESATENIMIVDQSGVIVHPLLDYILNGITMVRACELARANGLSTIAKSITVADLQSAREVMLTGTTLNVLPVVEFEGQKIGTGKPGYISAKLQELMIEDIQQGFHSFPF